MMNDLIWLPWKPMESAPKDKNLLLFWDDSPSVGWWDDDKDAKHPKPYWTCERAIGWHEKSWFRRNPPAAWCEITKPLSVRLPESVLGRDYEQVFDTIKSGDEKLTLDITWHPCLFIGESAENVGIVRRKSNT